MRLRRILIGHTNGAAIEAPGPGRRIEICYVHLQMVDADETVIFSSGATQLIPTVTAPAEDPVVYGELELALSTDGMTEDNTTTPKYAIIHPSNATSGWPTGVVPVECSGAAVVVKGSHVGGAWILGDDEAFNVACSSPAYGRIHYRII